MSLGTTVTCMTSSYYRPRNVYTVTDHATSTKPQRSRLRKPKRSFGSASITSSSKSTDTNEYDPAILYEISSRNCPCEHHRSARLREEISQNRIPENESSLGSDIVNNFEASVAPLRGFLTSSSSNGDSGINTNSNGSRRSSARGCGSSSGDRSRAFSLSSSSSSDNEDGGFTEVTTTVMLEQPDGCEDDNKQQKWWLANNKRSNKPIQISSEIDPSNNWTLLIKTEQSEQHPIFSIQEEEYDSLFSNSIKTSHSNSLKELCTCLEQDQSKPTNEKIQHKSIHRVASYPKCHPNFDPHRFPIQGQKGQEGQNSLRQLPTVPPPVSYFWPSEQKEPPPRPLFHCQSAAVLERPRRSSFFMRKNNVSFPVLQTLENPDHPEIPPCVRNVILQQLQSPQPPANPKMIRKLSKAITVPEDPSDPTAFTAAFHDHPFFYNAPRVKSKSRRSSQVVKIVGTFSFLMTMGIVITVLCFLYWSDTFKPMTMM